MGHAGFHKVLKEMADVHDRKSEDYGFGTDPLANCRASDEFGVPAWVGTMIRANDKVTRIKSYLANGKMANESVEDALLDLANYAVIALVLFRESQGDGPALEYATKVVVGQKEEWNPC